MAYGYADHSDIFNIISITIIHQYNIDSLILDRYLMNIIFIKQIDLVFPSGIVDRVICKFFILKRFSIYDIKSFHFRKNCLFATKTLECLPNKNKSSSSIVIFYPHVG